MPQPVLAAAALRLLRRLATLGFSAAAASLPPLLPRVACCSTVARGRRPAAVFESVAEVAAAPALALARGPPSPPPTPDARAPALLSSLQRPTVPTVAPPPPRLPRRPHHPTPRPALPDLIPGAPSSRLGEKLRLALLTPRRLAAATHNSKMRRRRSRAVGGGGGRSDRGAGATAPTRSAFRGWKRGVSLEPLLVLVEQHGDEQPSELLAAWEGAAGRGKLLDPPPPAPLAAARTDRTAGYDALLAGDADLGASCSTSSF